MWLKHYYPGMLWQYSFVYTNINRFVRSTVDHVPIRVAVLYGQQAVHTTRLNYFLIKFHSHKQ